MILIRHQCGNHKLLRIAPDNSTAIHCHLHQATRKYQNRMAEESDEDDYVFYGTSLHDEGDASAAAAGSKRDSAATRWVQLQLQWAWRIADVSYLTV